MHHYFNIVKEVPFTEDEINTAINLSTIGLLEDETKYVTFENEEGNHVLSVELHRQLEQIESDDLVEDLELLFNKIGTSDFVVEVSDNNPNFGDPNMRIKKSNPARRRSFRARHNCSNPGPRTKARYWSCRKW